MALASYVAAWGPAGPFSMPCAHTGCGANAETGRWNAPKRPVPAHPLAGVPACTNGPVSAVLNALDGVPAVGAPERFRRSERVPILPPGTVPRGFAAPPRGVRRAVLPHPGGGRFRRGLPWGKNHGFGPSPPARPSGHRGEAQTRASTRRTGRPGSSGRHRGSTRAPPWPRPSPSPWRRRSATPSGPRSTS